MGGSWDELVAKPLDKQAVWDNFVGGDADTFVRSVMPLAACVMRSVGLSLSASDRDDFYSEAAIRMAAIRERSHMVTIRTPNALCGYLRSTIRNAWYDLLRSIRLRSTRETLVNDEVYWGSVPVSYTHLRAHET